KDHFDVSIDDKIQFLLRLNEAAMKAKGVSFVNSAVTFQNEEKFYASTDGSRIEQHIIRSHPSFTVTAVNRSAGDFQTRSSLAGPKSIGYEYLETYPWLKEAGQAGEEAVAKLSATPGCTRQIRPGHSSIEFVADDTRVGRPLNRTGSRTVVGGGLRRHQF